MAFDIVKYPAIRQFLLAELVQNSCELCTVQPQALPQALKGATLNAGACNHVTKTENTEPIKSINH